MTIFNRISFAAALLLAMLGGIPSAFAQASLTSTTLSASVSDSKTKVFSVTSATGFVVGYKAFVDGELDDVQAINGTSITMGRGVNGSIASGHASGATIYVGPAYAFRAGDPAPGGACTATNEQILPVINYKNARRWNCINSQWMIDNGVMELPPAACYSSVSGNSTGTNGYTTAGTSLTPVVQAQTSSTGTNTHTYVCNVTLPDYLGGIGATLTDVVAKYGVQGGALGTQAATLASGTYNSSQVFSYLSFPAPGASETASTVAPTRADSGTMAITPAAASANTATTTAGAFYTQLFTPGVPVQIPVGAVDRRQLLFTLTLQNTATTATTTNVPGITVHYAWVPNEFFLSR